MKLTIGKVEFEVTPVARDMRAVLLAEPAILPGVWRDVWRWDAEAGTGQVLVPLVQNRALPLPNGLSFFVPKSGAGGVLVGNPKPTKAMAQRFLEAVGSASITDVLRALTQVLNLPQKTLPLDAFTPLNPVASYLVRAHVDFSVVQLRNAGRNLTAYLFVPGQIAFHHEVTAVRDSAAYEALMTERPELRAMQPAFVVPAQTRANLGIRRLALARRIEELRPVIEQISAAAKGETERPEEARTREVAQVLTEWRTLQAAPQPARTV